MPGIEQFCVGFATISMFYIYSISHDRSTPADEVVLRRVKPHMFSDLIQALQYVDD